MTLGLNKHFLFCLFSSTFVPARIFVAGKKGVTILWAMNHQITESWFYDRSWWCCFGNSKEKHNHVPVFCLVVHFRESQPPGKINHQWRPTTDRGQISMRSLSATVTWCLENYEKIPKTRVTGQICSKMVHLCPLNEMMVDLQQKTLPRVCRVPSSFIFTFFGIWLHCGTIELSGANLWLWTPHFRVHHKHLKTTHRRNRFGTPYRNASLHNERMVRCTHQARRPLRSWRKASRKLKRIPFLRRCDSMGTKGFLGRKVFNPSHPGWC